MKKLAFPIACALSALSVNAANIAWVSFHATDDPSTAAQNAAYGFTVATGAPDRGYTDLLRSAGHTVTRFLTTDALTSASPMITQLNSFDLVIVGRSVNSAHYEVDAETAAWNGVTAPIIHTGGYPLRNNRLGFTTGTTIPDTTGNVTLQATNPGHPIFAGITLSGGNTIAYAVPVSTPTGLAQRGISVNTDPVAGGGTILATTSGQAGVTGTMMLIGEWQAGATMGTTPADTAGGHRMVFLTGSREHAAVTGPPAIPTNSEIAGMYNLTPEGAQLFLNAVNYMAVPEPSTYALLGLGGLAILLRRRKA